MSHQKASKAVALLLVFVLVFALGACGGATPSQEEKPTKESSAPAEKTEETETPEKETKPQEAEEFTYPMEGNPTISWWISANFSQTGTQQERKNNPFMHYLQEATGVTLEFQHPPLGEESNAFNILTASNEMPDIISYNLGAYSGGMQQAIDDGVALVLDDYLESYMPNLNAYFTGDAEIARKAQSVEGDYAFLPVFVLDPYITSWFGWQIREDLLEEQDLEVPETMDEWYTTLSQLKEAYDLDSGLVVAYSLWEQGELPTAYNTSMGWDITSDGEVVYGPATPQFKDFLTEMHKWYNEGILHPDFPSLDNTTCKSLYNSGTSAAIVDSVGAMNNFIMAGKEHTPDFATIGAKYPVLNKGDKPYRGYRNLGGVGPQAFINGDLTEDKIETVLRFADYGYSEEGQVTWNFGKEGESFTYVDGYPTYTDLVLDNPEGIDARAAISLYTFADGPLGEQMREYFEQLNSQPYQKESITRWMDNDIEKHAYPSFARGTSEEEQRLSVIGTDLNTYRDEMVVKFIMGTEDLDNYDQYLENFEKFGLSEAVELRTKIYQEYMQEVS